MWARARPSLILLLLVPAALGTPSAQTSAPNAVIQVGPSEKICQLTGDVDWESGRPTPGRTFTDFGLDAVDLGYPVEHQGKLILLFGDTWPPGHPPGADPEVPPDDAVGVVTRLEPPGNDGRCLAMKINDRPGSARQFAPSTIVGPVRVRQGFFNVPSGGVSAGGALHAFFWTNHCTGPQPLQPSPDSPLARPVPSRGCTENDLRNSVGRGVMARSLDDARTFAGVVPMPTGFVYATAVNTALAADLPQDQRLGIFVLGAPRYRASIPYLAQAPIATLANPATWQFFSGRTPDGRPLWVTYAAWMRGAAAARGPAAWKPPGEPEIFAPASAAERCIGEFSITWNRTLEMWLLLYQCERRVWARVAQAPWGPWSTPTAILDAEQLGCKMLMTAKGCGDRRDYWPMRHPNGEFVRGGLYAPYVLNRFTRPAPGPGRRAAITWLVSTWNPYQVAVMRTVLQSAE
jgi:hypothetical protein